MWLEACGLISYCSRTLGQIQAAATWFSIAADLVEACTVLEGSVPRGVQHAISSVHGLRERLELHHHPGVGYVSRVRLLNDGASSHQEMLQPLQHHLLLLWLCMAQGGLVLIHQERDETAHKFTCNCRYEKLHGLTREAAGQSSVCLDKLTGLDLPSLTEALK